MLGKSIISQLQNPTSSMIKANPKKLSPRVGYEIVDSIATEPPREEVEEYAKRIGIDVEKEEKLLYLAREGLKQRLPEKWRPCFEPLRNVWYYYNTETLSSQWEHPLDEVYRDRVRLARGQVMESNNKKPSKILPLKTLPPLKKGFGGNIVLRESCKLKLINQNQNQQQVPPVPPPVPPPTPRIVKISNEKGDLGVPENDIRKDELKRKQEAEIELMKENHKLLIDELETRFREEENALHSNHTSTLTSMKLNFAAEKSKFLSSLKAQKEAEIAELEKKYDEIKRTIQGEIEELRKGNSGVIDELKDEVERVRIEHGVEIEEIKKGFREEESTLRSEHAKLLNDIKSSFLIEKDRMLEDLKLKRDEEIEMLQKEKVENQDKDKNSIVVDQNVVKEELIVSDSLNNNKTPIELELLAVKSKYKQLQLKYDGLKMELKSVIEEGHKKLKNENIIESIVTTSEDEGLQNSQSEDNQHNSTDANNIEESQIDDMIVGSNDRINKALCALEVVRKQIINNMKEGDGENCGESKKSKSSVDVEKVNSMAKASISKDRFNTTTTTTVVVTQPTTNNNNINHQIVAEAKDFIKAHNQRLKPRGNSTKNHQNFQDTSRRIISELSREFKNDSNNSQLSLNDSSGFGSNSSWRKSTENIIETKDTKEIHGILVSLKKLDDEMKRMWSMIGDNEMNSIKFNGKNLFKPLVHKISPSALAHFNCMDKKKVGEKEYDEYKQQKFGFFDNNNRSHRRDYDYHIGYNNNCMEIEESDETKNNNNENSVQLSQTLFTKTKDLREWLEKF